MLRETELVEGETYHIFNRGAHKQALFTNENDFRRFMLLLYLGNSGEPMNLRDTFTKYKGRTFADIFREEIVDPSKKPVHILGYCLMPNHFHLILTQISEGGITCFVRKICTAYSMYFNSKYEHSGVMFQGKFQSRHVNTDAYFRHIFAYVHLNPLDLVEHTWKEEGIKNSERAKQFIHDYSFSSFIDYTAKSTRAENVILALNEAPGFLSTQNDLEELLKSYNEPTKV